MTLEIGMNLGLYEIVAPLGAGGMGTIYEATQEKPRRTVALKLMKHSIASRSAMRRFEYESQILARLNHPGIAQVYATGEEDGTPFYAMKLVEEPSLNLVIRQIRDASRGMPKLKSAGMKWASASVILIRGTSALSQLIVRVHRWWHGQGFFCPWWSTEQHGQVATPIPTPMYIGIGVATCPCHPNS